MAIKDFKKIEDRKGYLVEDDDRQIFEKEIGKAYFGLGTADMIEFVLYDSSDNPLPQGDSGRLVRYINIKDEEAKKYFLVSENEFTKKTNGASEMIFDLEQLIRDAGYNTGIFKTQITLLNRRVGKEEIDNDKLWIHEISPSRTEIRLLPIKNTDNPSEDLLKRYETFTNEREFRDDTIYYIQNYIDSINIQRIFERFLLTKGKVAMGEQYSSLIKKEFKIQSLEEFFTTVKTKLVEAMLNFSKGNNYHITDINYGKPRLGIDLVELSIDEIKRTTSEILIEVIDFYLPKRNIQEKNILTPEQQITFDQVKQILKTVTSESIYDPSEPDEVNSQVRGCTDPEALNYNPLAEVENGTCQYREEPAPPQVRKGCTNSNALNYDEFATEDDGTCKFDEEVVTETPQPKPTITKTWYVWSNTASIQYRKGDTVSRDSYVEYDQFTITYDENGLTVISGDIREVPKSRPSVIISKQYQIRNVTHTLYLGQGFSNTPDPFDPNPFPQGSTVPGSPLQVPYQDKTGAYKQSSTIQPNSYITICAKQGSVVSMEGLQIIEQGDCGVSYPPPALDILGCTNSSARNYNPSATIDDGTCIIDILGCTDSRALNYNPSATIDNGTCRFLDGGGGGTSPGGEGERGSPEPGVGTRNRSGNPLDDLEEEQRNRTRRTDREL